VNKKINPADKAASRLLINRFMVLVNGLAQELLGSESLAVKLTINKN